MNDRIFVASQDENNGSTSAMRKRMQRTGTPFKQQDRRVKMLVGGRSALSVALENGISSQTFYKRIKMGWSVKDACTKTLGKQGKVNYDSHNRKIIPIPGLVCESV